MKGTSHIITGISSAMVTDTALRALSCVFDINLYDAIYKITHWEFVSDDMSLTAYKLMMMSVYCINIVLFIIGCLLPDCDQKNSRIGRVLYIPVEHRTWTHTIWCIILFSILSFVVPCFYWLTYGYFLHIFFDSLSKGGICWFYPISKYKKWTSGAQVKMNHKIYLYRTGEMSEGVLVTIVAIIAIIAIICSIQLTVHYGCLPFHGERLFAVNPV